MSDEWISSDLMMLAAEKDLVSCISCDAIIDSFASLGLLASGVYSIVSMKQLASLENLGGIEK
jgi:hypothetical protein